MIDKPIAMKVDQFFYLLLKQIGLDDYISLKIYVNIRGLFY